jgi:hypothetical protein
MTEYVLQQSVAQGGILMYHSSRYLFLTPFITWFVYRWKATLCLDLLIKLWRISHLRREKSGKDCGWLVIDELDQFILWYIHVLLHKEGELLNDNFVLFLDAFAPSLSKIKNSVMMGMRCLQAMRHVHHFTAQTKKPVE